MNKRFKNLGNFLKEARVQKGLSQGEVAKKLGYTSPQFISNCERGLCSLPVKNLRVLVDLYDLQASELIDVIYEEQQLALKADMQKMKKSFRNA